jgi:undecaprenyl pyrophosphate phosphatase UppP
VKYIRSFVRFWWEFIVGDDPRVAVGLAVALSLTWILEDHGVSAWWLLPVAVALLLADAVRREARGSG